MLFLRRTDLFSYEKNEPALKRAFVAELLLKMPQKNHRERPWHLHRSWWRTLPKWVSGRFQFFRGRYDKAEPLLLETVDHPRFSFSSWILLAKIAFLHGRVNHGRHRLLRALAANPRKFAKVREGWTALSPLWILDQGPQSAPQDPQEIWSQLAAQGLEDHPFFSGFAEPQERSIEAESSFAPSADPMVGDCEDEDCFFQFEFPNSEFEEFLFGEQLEGDEDSNCEENEDPSTEYSEEQSGAWGFTGNWDADWGSFLSEELFSSFAEEQFDEENEEDPQEELQGFSSSDEENLEAHGEAQNWERFIKNPEFLDPHEARKFSLLPPIRNSEFRNLDWTYLQSRLFPKGGKTEGRS